MTSMVSLFRPERCCMAYMAKAVFRVVLVVGVMPALVSAAAAAPVVFTAKGEFSSPTTGEVFPLSGTITIDTATGKVVSVDLEVDGVSFTAIPNPVSNSARKETELSFVETVKGEDGSTDYELYIVIPVSTLVGYDGGELVEGEGRAGEASLFSFTSYPSAVYGGDGGGYLYGGSLTPE
jgi:hypothetical protein